MGIKNLHPFLRKACPQIYNETHLSYFAYEKIAIDVSIYVCRFKTTLGKQWLDGFLQLVTLFRENEVHPIFVYDTKFPVEKDEEKKQRILSRMKTKEKTEKIVEDWQLYKQSFQDQIPAFSTTIPFCPEKMSNELYEFLDKTFGHDSDCNLVDIDREMDHLLNTLLTVRTEDFELTRKLLTRLGVPWLNASGEAEATCAVLCKKGWVKAVLSEDTDVLNYRSPCFLHKLNLYTGTVQEIRLEEMLNALEFTANQFMDFCIMCGTDYNSNLPKIGPEKAYKLIKKHGSLDEIKVQYPSLEMDHLPFKRVREIFLDDQQLNEKDHFSKIKFCEQPKLIELSEFCFHHNCRFDLNRLVKAFQENPYICFEEKY